MKLDLLTGLFAEQVIDPGCYLDGRGLYLQVRSESSKSWVLKFSMHKSAREMGLGPLYEISLEEARNLRDAYRSLIRQGIDPIKARSQQKSEEKICTQLSKIPRMHIHVYRIEGDKKRCLACDKIVQRSAQASKRYRKERAAYLALTELGIKI